MALLPLPWWPLLAGFAAPVAHRLDGSRRIGHPPASRLRHGHEPGAHVRRQVRPQRKQPRRIAVRRGTFRGTFAFGRVRAAGWCGSVGSAGITARNRFRDMRRRHRIASVYETEGCWFEPSRSRWNGPGPAGAVSFWASDRMNPVRIRPENLKPRVPSVLNPRIRQIKRFVVTHAGRVAECGKQPTPPPSRCPRRDHERPRPQHREREHSGKGPPRKAKIPGPHRHR